MKQIINRYYYRVAGHLFAVEYSNDILTGLLSNYTPFVEPTSHDATPIFSLRIERDGLLAEEQRLAYKHIFTDNSEEDMPRIEVYQAKDDENG